METGMNIPKYVLDILSRCSYEYDRCTNDENYAAGYTLSVKKHSHYARTESLRVDVERICRWANRIGGDGTAYVLHVPAATHYVMQSAVITIFDPVMKMIEGLIVKEEERAEV